MVVRGRIKALATVPALDGRPAVFVHIRARRHGRGAGLQKAEDFLLDAGTGTPIRVQVTHALYLDRPARVFGSWSGVPVGALALLPEGTAPTELEDGSWSGVPLEVFPFLPAGPAPVELEESALYPGAEVEVVGRAETRVDPTLSDRLERTTPLVTVLTGTPEEPLLLRSVF